MIELYLLIGICFWLALVIVGIVNEDYSDAALIPFCIAVTTWPVTLPLWLYVNVAAYLRRER